MSAVAAASISWHHRPQHAVCTGLLLIACVLDMAAASASCTCLLPAAGPSSSKPRTSKKAAAASATAAPAGAKAGKRRNTAAAAGAAKEKAAPRKKPVDPYEMEVDSDEEDEDAPGWVAAGAAAVRGRRTHCTATWLGALFVSSGRLAVVVLCVQQQ